MRMTIHGGFSSDGHKLFYLIVLRLLFIIYLLKLIKRSENHVNPNNANKVVVKTSDGRVGLYQLLYHSMHNTNLL